MRKKNTLITRILIAVIVIALLLLGVIVYGKAKLIESQKEKAALQTELAENQMVVYVAKTDVKKGDVLVAEDDGEITANVMEQEIYSGLESSNYITEENLGEKAIVDIMGGMPIMANMTTPLMINQDTREYEMSVVNLMTDQSENDYIDVRIMFPNGEDFLVLSKKEVKNLLLGSSIFYSYLSEDEIDRMASATIDAYTITGTRIYATRYVESNLQDAAIPNYLVNVAAIDLINSDPNILETAITTLNVNARIDLEERLGKISEEALSAVSEGHGLTDTAKSAVLLNNAEEQSLEEQETTEESAEDAASSNTDATNTTKDTETEETN